MNCELKTILDSSSLYRNGVLINYATASFVVEKCINVNLSVGSKVICCMGKQLTRVCFNVKNNDNRFLQRAILRISIKPYCSCCNCRSMCEYSKIYCLNCLSRNSSDCVCFNLPLNRYYKFKVIGKLIVDNRVIEEECIVI